MVNNIESLPFSESVKKQLQNLVTIALDRINNLDKVVLFGSYARMEQKVTSDFDIAIFTEERCEITIRGELCSIFDELNSDLVFYTNNEFQQSEALITKMIRKDGILLWQR